MLPLAYFLTWSTYGTHLHGDARGSVDSEHNQVNSPFIPPVASRERTLRARMKQSPMVLDSPMRKTVEQAITDHARTRRWELLALAVQSNHVHVVTDCRTAESLPTPERVMQEFKTWATRRLRRAQLISPDRRVWTDHGSTRWINNDEGLLAAVDYVNRLQSGSDARRRHLSK
jgi:REP element-mobilizing transposase RayT